MSAELKGVTRLRTTFDFLKGLCFYGVSNIWEWFWLWSGIGSYSIVFSFISIFSLFSLDREFILFLTSWSLSVILRIASL